MNNFKKALKSFNRWRREKCLFRLTVLILLFAPIMSEFVRTKHHHFLINELVWIACTAIRNGSQGNTENSLAIYYRYCAKKNLQRKLALALKAKLIPADDAIIPELDKKTAKTDLKTLFAAAKKYKLIDPAVNLKQLRRGFLVRAKGEYFLALGRQWVELDNYIFAWRADYSKWSSWQRGLRYFCMDILWWLFAVFIPYWYNFLLLIVLSYISLSNRWKYLFIPLLIIIYSYLEGHCLLYGETWEWSDLYGWMPKVICIALIAVLLGGKLNKLYPASKSLRIIKRWIEDVKVVLGAKP